ncbi:MAG TPA: ABC transporter ATP-binding protein, partial [Mucilaginibacter sp.]|nr:ABC transporter ATP-binding protein [Mucilaginibacter sp.]
MTSPIYSAENVTVRFLNNVLFSDLNFTVSKGQHWALVGESGSGKSALLQTIAGNLNATGG